jgi:hypothetical protein
MVPSVAIPKEIQATLFCSIDRWSARSVKTYPSAMMKNVVKTIAIKTPCAVTDR